MKVKIWIINLITIALLLACSGRASSAGEGNETKVLIKTNYGDMVVKLYNETPKHRDNFIKLVKEGYYNDLLFHRIIKDFMIQGGDPESKDASANKRLGSGGPGYEIPAEIVEGLYHKKGALAAARQGDNANPERKSSGSQFYIVQGKVWTEEELSQFEEQQKFQALRNQAMKMYHDKMPLVQRLQNEGKTDSINVLRIQIQEAAEMMVDSTYNTKNIERREIYTTLGGTPHLDGAYTVFGEVIEGLNVLDSIANVQTGPGDRPVNDLKMEMKIIE